MSATIKHRCVTHLYDKPTIIIKEFIMNREIKFRAWDSILKAFLPNVQNHINDKEWAFGSMLNNSRWTIQQYTGLKDKNGKEVYEGDLVTGFTSAIDVVKWKNNKARFSPLWLQLWNDGIRDTKMEVLGNIYENPELLSNTISELNVSEG